MAKVFFSRPLSDPWNIPGFGLAILFIIVLFSLMLHRFYRWRYYREARRRTEVAVRGFAPGS